MRRLAVGLLIGAATLALPGIAGGGGAGGGTLSVNPPSGTPGSEFTVSGTGCFVEMESTSDAAAQQDQQAQNGVMGPLVEVTVGFPTPLEMSTHADGEGAWSVTFTVPAGTPPGPYTITAECLNTPRDLGSVSALDFVYTGITYTVAAPVTPTPPSPGTPTAPAPAGTVPAPAPATPVAVAPALTG